MSYFKSLLERAEVRRIHSSSSKLTSSVNVAMRDFTSKPWNNTPGFLELSRDFIDEAHVYISIYGRILLKV
jgi:hypothetical protein